MHIKKRLSKMLPKKRGLSAQLERIAVRDAVTPFLDVEDDDVLGYVDQLLKSCSAIPPLERFSLLTKEDALKALTVIERAQNQVQGHLKTAKALRSLLESRGASTIDQAQ